MSSIISAYYVNNFQGLWHLQIIYVQQKQIIFYFPPWCNLVICLFQCAAAVDALWTSVGFKAAFITSTTQKFLICKSKTVLKNNNNLTNMNNDNNFPQTHLSCRRRSLTNSSTHKTPGGNEARKHWQWRALTCSKAEQLKTVTTPNPHMDFLPFLQTSRA